MRLPEAVGEISARLGMNKAQVEAVLKEYRQLVLDSLTEGEEVVFHNFFTLTPAVRPARPGRNPRTGETITIPEKKIVRMKLSKSFQDAATE